MRSRRRIRMSDHAAVLVALEALEHVRVFGVETSGETVLPPVAVSPVHSRSAA